MKLFSFDISSHHFSELHFSLQECPSLETIEHFKSLTKKLNYMTQTAGNNDRFKQRKQDILQHSKQTGDLINEIHSSLDIRAVVALWRDIDAFIKAFPVSKPILTEFHQIRKPLGLLTLIGLIQLFIKRFDQCGDIRELATFIRHEMVDRDVYSDDMKRLQKQANAVLSEIGPQKIIDFKMKNPRAALDGILEMVGIPADQPGRYIDVCRQCYYIESLKQLNTGEDSNIFDELVKDNISRQPYHDRCLGHEVLSIMIQKGIASGDELPENWRTIILHIAGDPRYRGQSYREWWSVLPQHYIDAMQGWMSGLDLKLFLQALDQHSQISGDLALRNMLPARIKFLEGLYKHKLIKTSKLFVGTLPRKHLQNRYKQGSLPQFSRLNDPELSVIYLKVGHMHMVEGSHNFSLRLYQNLPDNHPFSFNVRARGFGRRELGIGLAQRCERQYGGNVFSVTHHPPLIWQHKVIQELAINGIIVNPGWVL